MSKWAFFATVKSQINRKCKIEQKYIVQIEIHKHIWNDIWPTFPLLYRWRQKHKPPILWFFYFLLKNIFFFEHFHIYSLSTTQPLNTYLFYPLVFTKIHMNAKWNTFHCTRWKTKSRGENKNKQKKSKKNLKWVKENVHKSI